jgi:hypothetical protein
MHVANLFVLRWEPVCPVQPRTCVSGLKFAHECAARDARCTVFILCWGMRRVQPLRYCCRVIVNFLIPTIRKVRVSACCVLHCQWSCPSVCATLLLRVEPVPLALFSWREVSRFVSFRVRTVLWCRSNVVTETRRLSFQDVTPSSHYYVIVVAINTTYLGGIGLHVSTFKHEALQTCAGICKSGV